MLLVGWFCRSVWICAASSLTSCECAHDHESARSGSSLATSAALMRIDGSGAPCAIRGSPVFATSSTSSTSQGRSRRSSCALAGVSIHGKSGGSKSTIAR